MENLECGYMDLVCLSNEFYQENEQDGVKLVRFCIEALCLTCEVCGCRCERGRYVHICMHHRCTWAYVNALVMCLLNINVINKNKMELQPHTVFFPHII